MSPSPSKNPKSHKTRTTKTRKTDRTGAQDDTGLDKENSNYVLSEGHDDRVVVQDLTEMQQEIGLENMLEDDEMPVRSSEVSDELKRLLQTKYLVKSKLH